MQLAILLAAAAAAAGGAHGWDEDRNGFIQRSNGASIEVNVPIAVNILLVGLSHDGELDVNLDPLMLEDVLGTMFSTHAPYCEESKESINVNYQISYVVKAARPEDLKAITSTISSNIMPATQAPAQPGAVQRNTMFNIKAQSIESVLQPLVHTYFHDVDGMAQHHGPSHPEASEAFTLFLLNPKKDGLLPETYGSGSDFTYRWVYGQPGDTPQPTQTFMTKEGYIVVDLSAGPVGYGPSGGELGAVSSASLPSVHSYYGDGLQARMGGDDNADDMPMEGVEGMEVDSGMDGVNGAGGEEGSHDVEFRANIASTVVSCVRHIFVPDSQFDVVDLSSKVFVPLIVLRNHALFDPLRPDHAHSIDVEAIRAEISRVILPHQEISFVPVMHNLHDHPELSMAVRKSIRSDTVHEMFAGRYQLVTRPFLDSKLLEEELLEATDLLTSGLMSLSAPSGKDIGGEQWKVDEGDEIDLQASHGSRVLPVYVFSLLGLEQGLLMDNQGLVASTGRCVLALQSLDPHVALPYFTEKKGAAGKHEQVHLDARNPTRGIIAGVTESLASLTPPHRHFSRAHNQSIPDYRWSVGHHPFGPFAGSNSLPDIFVSHAHRNAVMARIHLAVSTLHDVVAKVELFAEDFMLDPTGDDIHHLPPASWVVDRLFHSAKKRREVVALPFNTVSSLHNQMEELEDDILASANLMGNLDMAEAIDLATRIVMRASRFHKYAQEQLLEAETGLLCCDVVHHQEEGVDWNRVALVVLVGMIVFFMTTNIGPAPQTKQRPRSRWDKKR